MSFKSCLAFASFSGAALLLASSTFAAPITAGQVAVAVNENNPVGGTTITQAQPFSTGSYTGTLVSSVITGDTTNTLGGLTFTYQLINDPTSANAITRLTVNGFTGYSTDMSYKLGTGGVSPIYNDRDATGGVVAWQFYGAPVGLGVVSFGTTSDLLVVQTSATVFHNVIANISNGAVSPVNAYGPAFSITPEPATLGALLGGAAVFFRRRRA